MMLPSLKYAILIGTLMLAVSCGSGGGAVVVPPNINANPSLYIVANLISFAQGAGPSYWPNAVVIVQEKANGISVTDAVVSINNTALTYNPAFGHESYEGNIAVAPGETVALSVTVREETYTATATQFTSYPTISTPVAGTWHGGIPNILEWTGGTPTADAVYNIGILDALDPIANLVWPTDVTGHEKMYQR